MMPRCGLLLVLALAVAGNVVAGSPDSTGDEEGLIMAPPPPSTLGAVEDWLNSALPSSLGRFPRELMRNVTNQLYEVYKSRSERHAHIRRRREGSGHQHGHHGYPASGQPEIAQIPKEPVLSYVPVGIPEAYAAKDEAASRSHHDEKVFVSPPAVVTSHSINEEYTLPLASLKHSAHVTGGGYGAPPPPAPAVGHGYGSPSAPSPAPTVGHGYGAPPAPAPSPSYSAPSGSAGAPEEFSSYAVVPISDGGGHYYQSRPTASLIYPIEDLGLMEILNRYMVTPWVNMFHDFFALFPFASTFQIFLPKHYIDWGVLKKMKFSKKDFFKSMKKIFKLPTKQYKEILAFFEKVQRELPDKIFLAEKNADGLFEQLARYFISHVPSLSWFFPEYNF